jgi:hypothetical protein
MNESKLRWTSAVVLGLFASGCGSVHDVHDATHDKSAPAVAGEDDDEEGDDENEVEVALDQVPEAVKKAALAAVPGLVLKSAEKETEEGTLMYCLEGTAGGEAVEVEVRASDSSVVEIERGEDDDGEDD